ncbi:hypothetical protein [Parasporobacterium paucivorans]|uniref:Uncharacterized protein n=1 Tax=Parasporobacterium paucivorans DSM 15970 TaxID=1122934 RepID=A0A1M6GJ06_9FIRM|nr:hypothetical protein [Parasporobacterium paucivorans]SHJ09934.1 hypothetical protein SAMN02745691_01339 [Parasporobacterium paucivorans DSM 15970]
MYVNAKKMALLGLLLAISVLLVILGGVIETSTFFLMAAAAFCTGIAIRENNIRIGLAFYLASVILCFLIAPNKLYCITYSVLGLYILISEFAFDRLSAAPAVRNRKKILWIIKYAAFNIMYIPMLVFFPKLFFAGEIKFWLLAGFWLAGQVLLFVYDSAYRYFQNNIWEKTRKKLRL